jgi:hypothetical protein
VLGGAQSILYEVVISAVDIMIADNKLDERGLQKIKSYAPVLPSLEKELVGKRWKF